MYPSMSYIYNSIIIQMLQKNTCKNKQSPKLPTSPRGKICDAALSFGFTVSGNLRMTTIRHRFLYLNNFGVDHSHSVVNTPAIFQNNLILFSVFCLMTEMKKLPNQ